MGSDAAWFKAEQQPKRDGWYEVQTPDVVGPYHTDAHWDGVGWWVYGKHVTLSVRRSVPVTRWRHPKKMTSNVHVTGCLEAQPEGSPR
jgi:hypothetical protein